MPIIPSIVSQHAEEAAFLWLLRDAAVGAPHYSLKELADLDERVEAHIDGLRVAGDNAWPFCAQGLDFRDPGEVFTAAVIALESDKPQPIEEVYAAVEAAPETIRGVVSAIGWTPQAKLQGKVAALLASDSALWRRAGIAACAVHRVDCGGHLTRAVEDPDPLLRARALRAVGETARRDLVPLLRRQIRSEDPESAFWAAWSAVLLGERTDGVAALKATALSEAPQATGAIQILLRVLPLAEAHRWLKALSERPNHRRDLISGCGISGDPVYVPWLIAQIGEAPDLARLAGEALSFITGVDIAYEDLEAEWPDGLEAGPTERREDEDVALDPDEDLPWPDPQRIAAWWNVNQERFRAGTRYLVGEPICEAHCRRILDTGKQRQRNAAALELALLQPNAALFETRAPGFHQRALLRRR